MKKRGVKLLVLFCLLFPFLFFFLGTTVTANAEEESGETLNESVWEQIENLDLEELQAYLDGLEGYSGESVAERLYDYVTGEGVDYGSFASQIGDVLLKNVKNLLPSFLCVTAVTLLCGVVTTLKSGFAAATSERMIFLIAYTAALIPVLSVIIECFSAARESVTEMRTQMQIIFPILLTLMSASGGATTAAICRPAVAFFSTTIVSIIDGVVFPITMTIIAFSIATHLSPDLKFGKFVAFFKSINKWIIGISVSIFGLFFTLQGITAASYDGITRRAAKYAIGTGVPIVGGFLSGGFDLAVEGSALIKNSLGSMSVFLLVGVLFEPLLLLVSVNLLLRLTAAVTQPLGDNRISDFLGETADNLNYCTAGLLFTAFLYFLCIVLIVCTSETFL